MSTEHSTYDYDDPPEPLRPPAAEDPGPRTWLLAVAAGALLVSLALLMIGGIGGHFAGYVLASFVASTLVALFRRLSNARYAAVAIGISRNLSVTTTALLGAAVALSLAHAGAIAWHYA